VQTATFSIRCIDAQMFNMRHNQQFKRFLLLMQHVQRNIRRIEDEN